MKYNILYRTLFLSSMKRTLVFLTGLLSVMAFVPSVMAQTEGLTLNPVIVERSVEAGKSYNLMVKVQGNYSDTKGVDVKLSSFTYKDTSGEPQYIDQDTPESRELASWFTFDPLFTLEPRRTVNFPIALTVPENTKPGGYYATIFFEPQSVVAPASSGATTKVRMGAHILLTVNEESAYKKLTLEGLRLSESEMPNEDTIVFEADIKNEGNIHMVPGGRIEVSDSNGAKINNLAMIKVKNASGQIIAEVPSDFLPVNEESMRALPGQLRTIRIPWKLTPGQALDDTYTIKYLMAEEGKTDFQEKTITVDLRKSIEVSQVHMSSEAPLVYSATLKNTGTVAVTPAMALSVKDYFSRDAWIELKQASQAMPLLPGEERTVVFSQGALLSLPWVRVVQIDLKDSIGNTLYTAERLEMEWQVYTILALLGLLIIIPTSWYMYRSHQKKTTHK